MNRHTVSVVIVGCVLGMLSVNRAVALNQATHAIVNEQVARRSGLDQVLKEQLGLPKGIEQIVHERQVVRWLGEGGIREDDGLRFFHHFHDPLRPWDRAGLGLFSSSVRWMQEPGQAWSWAAARRYYLQALTAETRNVREQAWANTFRALGQLMHLVVDASVPEHVRSNPHPFGRIFGNYEYWVSGRHADPEAERDFLAKYLANPLGFATWLLWEPTDDPQAPLPIARLLDNNLYQGTLSGPNVTLSPASGIAEIANANFFSEHTLAGEYPFPDIKALIPSKHPAPMTGHTRAYFKKADGDGFPVDPVLAECVFYEIANAEGVVEPVSRSCVDENVWTQTAEAMLPRAVGYARDLLDYFFRGRLDFQVRPHPTDPTQQEVLITNTSYEAMAGDFALYAEDSHEGRSWLATFPLDLGPWESSEGLPFTPPADISAYVVVFQGRLEAEEGAIVGKAKPQALPYIFVLQETAEVRPELLRYEDATEKAVSLEFDTRHQVARGTFAFPGVKEPGRFIKRIRLDGNPTDEVQLLINGVPVGQRWSRDRFPDMIPATWEIRLNLTIGGFSGGNVPAFPRSLIVDQVDESSASTPLVWWGEIVTSRWSLRGETSCKNWVSWRGIEFHRTVRLFFGDGDRWGRDGTWPTFPFPFEAPHTNVGFTPIGSVEGFPVGTVPGILPPEPDPCAIGDFGPSTGAQIFVREYATPDGTFGKLWNKHSAWIGTAEYQQFPGVDSGPLPEPPPLPFSPEVTLKRDYLPWELERFQRLNITPPESVIRLKIGE